MKNPPTPNRALAMTRLRQVIKTDHGTDNDEEQRVAVRLSDLRALLTEQPRRKVDVPAIVAVLDELRAGFERRRIVWDRQPRTGRHAVDYERHIDARADDWQTAGEIVERMMREIDGGGR